MGILSRSYTSAWIETVQLAQQPLQALSRSYTSAWIETQRDANDTGTICRALTRARGLKLIYACRLYHKIASRSYTSAWIETHSHANKSKLDSSRSYTSAWIETSDRIDMILSAIVALLHERVD